MTEEIFEYRRQARGPQNYLSLALVTAVLYAGWSQGWGLIAILLCGPFIGFVLARLIENQAEGFRMTGTALEFYDATSGSEVAWLDLNGVTITGDGAGGSHCLLHLHLGRTLVMPATQAFAPERLTQEFRQRGIPVWRSMPQEATLAAA